MERIAFNTSRKSTSIGRPAFDARGRKGSIRAHSSSVKSLGYRLVFFSIVAIRPRVAGVHIPSLNHGRKPHSTTFQTDSQASRALSGKLSIPKTFELRVCLFLCSDAAPMASLHGKACARRGRGEGVSAQAAFF